MLGCGLLRLLSDVYVCSSSYDITFTIPATIFPPFKQHEVFVKMFIKLAVYYSK